MIRTISIYIAILLSLFSSCTKAQEENNVYVSVRNSELSGEAGEVFVSVKSEGEWNISLIFDNDSGPWASLSVSSGSGQRNDIVLSYDRNDGPEQRRLHIKAVSGVSVASCEVAQQPAGASSDEDKPVVEDPVTGWMELPAIREDDGLYFFTHYQNIVNKTIRSWSFNWDVENMVAHWVAYPLNSWTIGKGGRTDEWGLDPHLPESMQPVLYKGYSGGRYDRGHQIPSADRLNRTANIQTFYGTNMTPQMNSLNGAAWASLEGQVRTWANSMDTLYVVTGCVVEGSSKYAYDNVGKRVTVPIGYYKALLGYKKTGTIGITAETGGYTGCAFWFDHEAYSGDFMNMAMTIAELEEKVGIDFFVNLPSAIGEDMAEKVETTVDSWW